MSDGGTSEADISNNESGSLSRLVRRFSEKVCKNSTFAVSDHASAARLLQDIFSRVVAGERLDQDNAMAFLCSGIAMHRKHAYSEGEPDEIQKELKRTAVLCFIVISVVQAIEKSESSDSTKDADVHFLEHIQSVCLWDQIRTRPRRKRVREAELPGFNSDLAPRVPDIDAASFADSDLSAMSKPHLPPSAILDISYEDNAPEAPGEEWRLAKAGANVVASSALRLGSFYLEHGDMAAIHDISDVFFRASIMHMSSSLLKSADGADFLTLDTGRFVDSVNDRQNPRLNNVAQAAESDLGQCVFRDMMQSFLLPPYLLSTRRTLLLPRGLIAGSGSEHNEVMQLAHDAAMQGTGWTWEHSDSEVQRMCALLAGLAVMTTNTKEFGKKADAFSGRVQLPFLEVPNSLPSKAVRMALIPETSTWVCYRLRNSRPDILSSKKGFEGMLIAVLRMIDNL